MIKKNNTISALPLGAGDLISMKIEDCLALPVHVYLKDKRGVYRECNEAQARSFGLGSSDDVIGRMDRDLLKEEEAFILRQNERIVVRDEKPQMLMECATFNRAVPESMISLKMPIRDHNGSVIAVLGLSFPANDGFSALSAGIIDPARLSFKAAENLSNREKQCVYYLVRGKTAKEIARVLNLSPRTVEFYVGRLKVRWGCRKTTELVSKILQSGHNADAGVSRDERNSLA